MSEKVFYISFVGDEYSTAERGAVVSYAGECEMAALASFEFNLKWDFWGASVFRWSTSDGGEDTEVTLCVWSRKESRWIKVKEALCAPKLRWFNPWKCGGCNA
jgi:hypothetical protein